jgi:threonyl-tRNA synthetase
MMEEVNKTGAAFMEVTSRKIDLADKKIASLEEKIKNIPDNTVLIQELVSTVETLKDEFKNNQFPVEKVQDLSAKLDKSISLLKQPVKKEILHHHHVPKIILISSVLFIALALVCSGWYLTAGKLDSYIANDTKYRQLRLDTSLKSLQHYLDLVDSLYDARPDMRKIVLETEEKNRENFERLEKAARLKVEAKDLEMMVKKKQ